MNLELIEKMEALLAERRQKRSELAEEYKTARGAEAKRIYNEVDELVKGNTEINRTIKAVKKANAKVQTSKTEEEMYEAANELQIIQEELYALAEKYNVEISRVELEATEEKPEEVVEPTIAEQKVEKQTEEKKSYLGRNLLVGAVILGTGMSIGSCMARNNDVESMSVEHTTGKDDEDKTKDETTETTEETIDKEVEEANRIRNVDTEVYGMTSALTDASDEKQVMQRANDIYNTYINIDSMPAAMKQQLSVERIANFIRMANGEFALEDGQIEYNAAMHDEMANFMAAYCNATSFVEYGTDLEFKPTCVFYENDTLAHTSAVHADELVSVIYEDIRNNDIEKFKEDSIKWGEFVRDTFVYTDFTGETISIWSVDDEQKYPLVSSIISVYAPSIMEYSLGVDLASRDGKNGPYSNTFGICIPFCYNDKNELTEIPLSELIYHINFTPMNHLADRAGFGEEWAEEYVPISVRNYNMTKTYFESKYALEAGQAKTLK